MEIADVRAPMILIIEVQGEMFIFINQVILVWRYAP